MMRWKLQCIPICQQKVYDNLDESTKTLRLSKDIWAGMVVAILELTKQELPRIMAINFSRANVEQMVQFGLNVRRGYTRSEVKSEVNFCLPWAIQDVDIVIFRCIEDGMSIPEVCADDSVETQPHLKELIREVWKKNGWAIFFVEDGWSPDDFETLGISGLGVYVKDGAYTPVTRQSRVSQSFFGNIGYHSAPPQFPLFKGQQCHVMEDSLISGIIQKHVVAERPTLRVLSTKGEEMELFDEYERMEYIMWDDSADKRPLAIRFLREAKSLESGLMVLPSFGARNIDVAIDLIKNVIPHYNAKLYSNSRFGWIDSYRPVPIRRLEEQRQNFIDEMEEQIAGIEHAIADMNTAYEWLDGLLVATDDEFAAAVMTALEFIEFEVTDVDATLADDDKKREDLHIRDLDFFAIGEAKSTRRGASETFLTKVQNHQARYSIENDCSIPYALLFVNHSYELEPSKRYKFYADSSLATRCQTQRITAIDSVYLHDLCQRVLSGEIDKESARKTLTEKPGVLAMSDSLTTV